MRKLLASLLLFPVVALAQYNGAGVYVRPYNWVNDAAASIPITASRMDGDMNAVVSALNNAVTRDGQGYFSANINAGNHALNGVINGTTSVPSISAYSSTNTGLYFGSGTVGITAAGTSAASFNATGATINGNVTISAPSSGNTLTINALAAQYGVTVSSPTNANPFAWNDGTNNGSIYTNGTNGTQLTSIYPLSFTVNSSVRMAINQTGNVTINSPSSGTALAANAASGYAGLNVGGIESSPTSTVLAGFSQSAGSGIKFIPNVVNGAYSNASQSGDALIFAQGASSGTGALTLGTWSSSAVGIRITGTNVQTIGPVIVNSPSSGTALTVAASATTPSTSFGDAAAWGYYAPSATGTNAAVLNFASSAMTAVGITSYSSGTVTIKYPGTYFVSSSVEVSNGSTANTGTGGIAIYKNGATTNYMAQSVTGSGFQNANVTAEGTIVCAAGDTITVVSALANGGQVLAEGHFSGYRIPGL